MPRAAPAIEATLLSIISYLGNYYRLYTVLPTTGAARTQNTRISSRTLPVIAANCRVSYKLMSDLIRKFSLRLKPLEPLHYDDSSAEAFPVRY